MKYDMLIAGGRVIDPSRNLDAVGDLYVRNGHIVEGPETGGKGEAKDVVDASGYMVTPGLIDFHLHIAHRSSSLAINPDVVLPANGVTSANDGGTTGTDACESFIVDLAHRSPLTIKCFINILQQGVPHHCMVVDSVEVADEVEDAMRLLLESRPDDILGVKLWSRLGGKSLENGLDLAEKLGQRLCIHGSSTLREYDEVMDLLRGGDCVAHFYHDRGSHILDDGGKVKKSVWKARERGVVFDTANGKANYAFDVARKAFEQGFYPDIISSDCTHGLTTFSKYTFGLPYVMSGYYGLGLSLMETLRCVTETPAKYMGLEGRIGTLRPGAWADISILRLDETPHRISDARESAPVESRGLFISMATIKRGDFLHKRLEFEFLR